MWRIWEDMLRPNQSTCSAAQRSNKARIVYGPRRVPLLLASMVFFFSSPLPALTPGNASTTLPPVATMDTASSESQKIVQPVVEGLTRQQGDAILQELRSIRKLLQQQQTATKPRKRPTSASIKLGEGHPSQGKADAPVTMLEFSDYQCPYCKQFHDTSFPKLREKYIDTGKLRYVSMDLPLRFHPQARPAANAARCAAEQDKFWQMRETLFKNSRALGQEALLKYAVDLSLDVPAFSKCLEQNRYDPDIQRDMQAAGAAGFTGTPSFVIGKNVGGQVSGVALIGAKPLQEFENHIRRLLPKVETGG